MVTKEELINLAVRIARSADVKMAIGGGIAVNAYGYRRETADVDAFFHYPDQKRVLRALNDVLGDEFILEELDPSHWTLTPVDSPPDERVDLLFAIGDPEESAIEMGVAKKYRKTDVTVFPVDLLVISKFLASRDDAKDALDIYALLKRGAVDVGQITTRFRQMGLDEDAARFESFVTFLAQLPSKKGRR